MNYYYFAATLPALSMEAAPPFSFTVFRGLCAQHLSPKDLNILDEAVAPMTLEPKHTFVKVWTEQETQLRNAVARLRASRLRRDVSAHIREHVRFDTYVEKAANEAFARENPRERELALDRFRWSQIDSIAGYDPFTLKAILAYALKLKLAERWAAFDKEKGKDKVDEIVGRDPDSS